MDKKGNLIVNLFFFIFAVGMLVTFISPLMTFVNIAQQSDNLNCQGYLYNGDNSSSLSFNSTLNGGQSGSPMGCIAIKWYLPYIIIVFLITGVASVLYNQGSNFVPGQQGG